MPLMMEMPMNFSRSLQQEGAECVRCWHPLLHLPA